MIFKLKLILFLIQLSWIIKNVQCQSFCSKVSDINVFPWTGIALYSSAEVALDPTVCIGECFASTYKIAGIWKSKYCFCADALPFTTNETLATCATIDSFVSNKAEPSDVDYVFDILPATLNYVQSDTADLTFTTNEILKDPPTAPVKALYSWSDRDNIWESTPTLSSIKRRFVEDGIYELRMKLVKPSSNKLIFEASKEIVIERNAGSPNLTCQPNGVVHILATCTLGLTFGGNLQAEILIDDVSYDTFQLTQPKWQLAGNVVNYFDTDFVPAVSIAGTYILSTEIQYSGTLTHVTFHAKGTTAFDLLLLSPVCATGTFCFSSRSCSADILCSGKMTCATPNTFCSSKMACSNICARRLLNQFNETTLPVDYKVEKVELGIIPVLGMNHKTLTVGWPVTPGFKLGVRITATDIIGVTTTRNYEAADFFRTSSVALTVGTTLLKTDFTAKYIHHQISAVIQPKLDHNFKIMINDTGLKTVKVKLTAPTATPPVEATSTINIGLNINDTIFLYQAYALLNEPKIFDLQYHTGSNLIYKWDFGDGTTNETTTDTTTHTYTVQNTYLVNVTVTNNIVTRHFNQSIKVIKRVIINSIIGEDTPAYTNEEKSYTISVAGDNYNCTLSINDVVNETLIEPVLLIKKTWTVSNNYKIKLHCFNQLSNSTKEFLQPCFFKITGLRFDPLGGEAGVPYNIKFRWTTGDSINFTYLFDNVTKTTTADPTTMTGQAEPVTVSTISSIIGVVRGVNPVSDIIVVANLTFVERVTDLIISPNTFHIQHGSPITFGLKMTKGSSFNVTMNYGDGTANDTVQLALLEKYTNQFIKPHNYANIGNYNATVVTENLLGFTYAWAMIYIIGPMGVYSINSSHLFLKINDDYSLNLILKSGNAASMANMTIDWKDGTPIKFIAVPDFNAATLHTHKFSALGEYNVTVTIANPIETQTHVVLITILNPITNFKCINNPLHTWNSNPMTFTITLDLGSRVMLNFIPGLGETVQTHNLGEVTTANTQHIFTHSYVTVNNYTANVTAYNPLGSVECIKYVVIQYKVIRADFTITPKQFVKYGLSNDFTIQFTGTNYPANLNAIFNYNDGQAPITKVVKLTDMPFVQPKILTNDGRYNVTVKLENLANSESYSFEIGAFKPFTDISVETSWGTQRSAGFGAEKNRFPIRQPIYFKIAYPNGKGTVEIMEFYYVQVAKPSTIKGCNITLVNNEAYHTFLDTGDHNVSIVLRNPIDTYVKSMLISIGTSMKDSRIILPYITLLPMVLGKVIVQWTAIDISACICIDFGNKTHKIYGATRGCSKCTGSYTNEVPIDNRLITRVQYPLVGDYNIKVFVYNEFENATVNHTLAVSRVDCQIPQIMMKEETYVLPETPQVGHRGEQNVVRALISQIPCVVTKENIKRWTARQLDEEYFRPIKNIDMSHLETYNNTQLIISPRYLPLGLYQLIFSATMDTNKTIQTFINYNVTHIKIIPTDVQVKLSKGGLYQITRGLDEEICLTPKAYTIDPDLDVQNFDNWTWIWTCREISETVDKNKTVEPKPRGYTAYPTIRKGCFGDGPAMVKFKDSSQPCFAGDNMEDGKTYEFEVFGSVGVGAAKRSGTSKLQVYTVKGIPPIITIQCMRSKLCRMLDGIVQEVSFNPSDDLLINASCKVDSSSVQLECTQGTWLIEIQNTTTLKWIELSSEISSHYIKGMNSMEMSLLTVFWDKYSDIKRFRACYQATGRNTVGKSCIQFFVNSLPSGINCTIDKKIVKQTEDLCASCTLKPELEYRFFINNTRQIITLGFTDTGKFCSNLPYFEEPVTYNIRITNKNGGFIDKDLGKVTVTKIETKEMESILESLLNGKDQKLKTENGKGDYIVLSKTYLTYVSVITASQENEMRKAFANATGNVKLNLGGTGYDAKIDESKGTTTIQDLDKATLAKLEENRDKKSKIMVQMTRHLDTLVPSDINSLYLISGVVNSLCQPVDTLNRESQGQLAIKIAHLTRFLNEKQDETPRSDIIKISESLISAVVLTDTAANTQLKYPINSDLEASKLQMSYDVNLENDDGANINKSPDQALYDLIQQTSTDVQSKVAFGVNTNSMNSLTLISKILRGNLVVDDTPINIEASNFVYYTSKEVATNLNNKKFNKGRGEVVLPNICKAFNLPKCDDPNAAVGVEIMATPTNSRAFSKNSNGRGCPIPLLGEVMSVSLFGSTGNSFSKSKDGKFIIFVVRDPTQKKPDFTVDKHNPPKIPAPRQIPGTGSPITGPKCFYQKLYMHEFTLTGADQSVNFEMKIDGDLKTKCTQYLIVARLGQPPVLSDAPDGKVDPVKFEFVGLIPSHTKYCTEVADKNTPNPLTFFISNFQFKAAKAKVLKTLPDYSSKLNTLYYGVRELDTEDFNKYSDINRPPTPFPSNKDITTNYSVRIYSSSCYFFSDNSNGWNTNGCEVGPLTDITRTQCICDHLTSFSSGFIVAPNTIDFNYIFSNFKFEENITIFVTEIAILVIFGLIMIWARRQDNNDLEKVGVTPLNDNDPEDMYLYEIIVDTSIRNGAGTKSNVYFILSGESDETDVRKLEDKKRAILKRGSVDRFLLAVPRSLGNLQYIRLWHDNSGKGSEASWYCNYFGITDLQTKEKYHFLINRWFAVEEDDGQIDRLIAVASVEELLNFGEVFTRKMKQDLTEDHLWLSIMARPPESRFTRLERVACCLLLLFLTMLTTCMFYETEGPTPANSNVLTVGPFALTAKEVWTGLISNIIGFLPLFIIIELFRRSQLKNSHGNRLRKVVEDHLGGPAGSTDFVVNTARSGSINTSRSTAALTNYEMNQGGLSSRPQTPGIRTPEQVDVQVIDNVQQDDKDKADKSQPEKRIVRRRLLPWWVRIITWCFLGQVLIVAIVFTTFYGIQFGDEACKKWISSMFISFFASVLLTQPIKVVLLAMFFSLICRKSDKMEEIEFVDDENELMNELGQRNGLQKDEEYLHEELYNEPVRPQRKLIQPPPKEEVERARELRLKEKKMFDILREIFFYLIYFSTLLVVTYTLRDSNAFVLKTQLEKVFISNPDYDFTKIRTEDSFWEWGINVLIPSLRAPVWYNNAPQLFQRGFTIDRNNRLIGYAVMRQLRVKKNSCKVYSYVKHLVDDCYGSYSITSEEKTNFSKGWQPYNEEGTPDEGFFYKTASQLDGLPYVGRLTIYGGGGYVHEFRGNTSMIHKSFLDLKENHWIDAQTRAIFIEFTTYNPNINLFAINTFLLEFPGSGGMWATYRIEPANLLGLYASGVAAFEIFCQVLYGIFILVMIIKEIRNLIREKWKYFTQFWNLCEIFLIIGSFACVAAFAYVKIATGQLTEKFSRYGGKVYIKFQYVAMWNEYLSYLVSFIVFVATLKFIKLLRFNKKMGMLGSVLSYSARDMKQFFIIFLIMFLAFVMVFYSLFMDSLYRYHTFLHATEASMQIALGKFEFLELYQKEPIFGPIVFAFYVIFIIFVMLNMFIAILNEGFAMVRADIELQSNDFEMVEFVTMKFLLWTGISNTKVGQRLLKQGVTDQIYRDIDTRELAAKVNAFPDKVDQLLSHINRIITGHTNNNPRNNADNKSFSSVLIDKQQRIKSKPRIKSDNDDYNEPTPRSRPSSAASNIIKPKEKPTMTPIDQ